MTAADILCTNETLNAAIIIEEKFSRSKSDESLEKKAQEAIEQIISTRHANAVVGYSTVIAAAEAKKWRLDASFWQGVDCRIRNHKR